MFRCFSSFGTVLTKQTYFPINSETYFVSPCDLLAETIVSCLSTFEKKAVADIVAWFAQLRETWLGNNASWFAHLRERWLETMFPGLPTFEKHG
jgi:hypothetical protein